MVYVCKHFGWKGRLGVKERGGERGFDVRLILCDAMDGGMECLPCLIGVKMVVNFFPCWFLEGGGGGSGEGGFTYGCK